MNINPHIFRAYDIRGIAFKDFNKYDFYRIGKTFAQIISEKTKRKNPKILVTGDGRRSGAKLMPFFLQGLKNANTQITFAGDLPTPINYMAFHEGLFDASVQMTASHNPTEYNGLKLLDKDGSFAGEKITDIYKKTQKTKEKDKKEFIIQEEIIHLLAQGAYNIRDEYFTKYKNKIIDLEKKISRKKVIIDAGNGISGKFYPQIFRDLGYEVIELFCDLDTNFPNHHPDPEDEQNLKLLQKKVLQEKADFGVAFDGDGDRFGIVMKTGKILSPDKIAFVLGMDALSRNTNAKIILDAMSGDLLAKKLKSAGGNIIWSKTGHSNIELKIKEESAIFGAEQSGHYFFSENFYGHDDACLGSLRFLAALGNSQILNDLENYETVYEKSWKITVEESQKFAKMDEIIKKIREKYPNANTLDGVRISFDNNSWGIVRASNTSPKISFRVQAMSQKKLNECVTVFSV